MKSRVCRKKQGKSTRGAGMVEYATIVCLVVGCVLVAYPTIQDMLTTVFLTAADKIDQASHPRMVLSPTIVTPV